MIKVDDFIIEIGTEELPPKDLSALSASFTESLANQLAAANLSFKAVKPFVTARRLAVFIQDLALQQPEQQVTKRGPAINAAFNADGSPSPAAIGFANSCGVEFQGLTTQITDKGEWLLFEQNVVGEKTADLLPSMVEKALSQLPVKKHMRWGTGDILFVRPIHWILMMHGKNLVQTQIWGIMTGNTTRGHRIHAPEIIRISHANTYLEQLEKEGQVIADFEQRKTTILHQINTIAKKIHGNPIIDPDLLSLVTGLVEHPVALLANFAPEYLRVPKECLISAMQDHQKCFALLDANGQLMPHFILIANLKSTDPETVIKGNELVMHARLADAAFHYDNDQKQTLVSRVEKLNNIVYQKQLGTLYDKVIRVQKLAEFIAPVLKADPHTVSRAAYLCKADLLTNMVYEFPELQGIMGYYYALHDKEPEDAALAIEEHYQPRFAGDQLPTSNTGITLALADRIDTLVGFFGLGNIPTGEKDPFALRRQTLAVLRILIEKNISLDLAALFNKSYEIYGSKFEDPTTNLIHFCVERLKAWYLGNGGLAKTFAAVATRNITNPCDFNQRLEAVNEFQQLPAAASLAAANKRVQNLLEKSADQINLAAAQIEPSLISTKEEQELFAALKNKEDELSPLLKQGNYSAVLRSLASLHTPVDNFFNNVLVMVDDPKLRNNRLLLLQRLRNLFLQVADVSLL